MAGMLSPKRVAEKPRTVRMCSGAEGIGLKPFPVTSGYGDIHTFWCPRR